jgi:hypothetical protein
MQDIARDAVLAVINGNSPLPVANAPPPPAAHKLREAAATARALADQLAALAGGLPAELEPDTITISTESLIQMLTEAVQNGPDTPVEARIERVQRIVAEIGEAVAPPAAPDSGATPTDRRKRGSNR